MLSLTEQLHTGLSSISLGEKQTVLSKTWKLRKQPNLRTKMFKSSWNEYMRPSQSKSESRNVRMRACSTGHPEAFHEVQLCKIDPYRILELWDRSSRGHQVSGSSLSIQMKTMAFHSTDTEPAVEPWREDSACSLTRLKLDQDISHPLFRWWHQCFLGAKHFKEAILSKS